MTNSTKHRARRGLTAALVLLPLVAGSALAQDRSDRAERLNQALDLTDEQARLVDRALADPAPGALWQLAADLAPTLSDAQKQQLAARPDRAARPEKGDRGERGAKERRADRSRAERPDSTARAERREAMQARREADRDAMRTALGLSDEQVQRLDALREQHRAERREAMQARREQRDRAERPERGAHQAALAEILTPQQEEILRVHHALAMRLGPHRGFYGARR